MDVRPQRLVFLVHQDAIRGPLGLFMLGPRMGPKSSIMHIRINDCRPLLRWGKCQWPKTRLAHMQWDELAPYLDGTGRLSAGTVYYGIRRINRLLTPPTTSRAWPLSGVWDR